jgi:mannose-6-phosphate isomerase-like protein (cupin superfamily)
MSYRSVTLALRAAMLASLASSALVAQSTISAPATILTPAQLKAITDSLPAASLASIPLGVGSGYTYALTHRDLSGVIEVHMQWTDIFVIQSGSATLVTGGSLAGAKEASTGEWREGRMTGSTSATLKAGDVVIIPASTPHQFQLAPGEQVNYLTFKIAAATK